MTLKTQMTTDLAVFYNTDEFAETVIYSAVGEDAVNISAIVTRQGSHLEPYVRGAITASAIIEAMKSEVPTPHHGDVFVFDSQFWTLDPDMDGGMIYEDDEECHFALIRIDDPDYVLPVPAGVSGITTVLSEPGTGQYRIKSIRLDADKKIVVTYDETPAS